MEQFGLGDSGGKHILVVKFALYHHNNIIPIADFFLLQFDSFEMFFCIPSKHSSDY